MSSKVTLVFLFLCLLFLVYSFTIYLGPLWAVNKNNFENKHATNGRLVWQKYNCQSCHQLYGLGGYLGPDLTNIISHPQKGEAVLKPLIENGSLQMPAFKLPPDEMNDLIAFLKCVDASGSADPRRFSNIGFGMIKEK